MSYNAQKLIRQLPRELKLTASSRRLLDYLGLCANEEEAQKHRGDYFAFPSEDDILYNLTFSSATLYRCANELEFTCGFYLITRRNRTDARRAGYDLHIQARDLLPEAILARKQSADARLSASRGKAGARKRNTSQNERYLPGVTSQNERYSEPDYLSKRDVITSQNESQTPEITSQNERQNKECIGTIRNLNREGGERPAPDPPKNKNPQKRKLPAVTVVLDKHAEMWEAALNCARLKIDLPEKFETPEAKELLNGAMTAVGNWGRFRNFKERPRDESFARKEFLDYLRSHDPAYEAAVGVAIAESLDDRPPRAKAKAARGP